MADTTIIHIDALAPGMYVVSIVAQHGPVKIRKQGHITSFDMVKGLKEMGVTELAIDPSQTLELEPTAPVEDERQSQSHTSQTQHLLMQKDAREVDSQMSEQFNRSVFLPSIQRLPGFWQLQGPKLFKFTGAAVAGLLLGYSVMWWYLLPPQTVPDTVALPKETTEATSPVALPLQASTANPAEVQTAPNEQAPISSAPSEVFSDDVIDNVSDNVSDADTLTDTDNAGNNANLIAPEEGVLLTQQAPTTKASPAVQAKLAEVLAQIESNPLSMEDEVKVKITSNEDLPRIGQLPAHLLTRMPNMVFAQHLYASVASERWVRVNNRRMQEGDMIDGRVTIIAIEPQQVVLEIDGTRFTMAALTDW